MGELNILPKSLMRRCPHDHVKRLARWLHLKHIDEMSHRQLVNLLHWLFTRRIKRERNLIM